MTPKRTELLTIRVTPDEMLMIKALAEADGISASDVVRMFVRRSYVERFDEPTAARKTKPKRK